MCMPVVEEWCDVVWWPAMSFFIVCIAFLNFDPSYPDPGVGGGRGQKKADISIYFFLFLQEKMVALVYPTHFVFKKHLFCQFASE